MDWIIKLTVIALISGLLVVIIQKSAPANALLITIASAVMIALASVSFLEPILSFVRKLVKDCEISGVYTGTMIKCLLIAIVTRLGASLCKDAGQSGMASMLDFSGTIISVWIALPLFEAFLSMLEELM